MGLIKPGLWAFDPAFTNPEFRWFWDKAVYASSNWEGTGNIYDGVSNIKLPPSSTPATWIKTPTGWAIRIDANSEGFQVTAPISTRLDWPLTMFMGMTRNTASIVAQGVIFGILHNSTASDPFVSYEFSNANTSGLLQLAINSGGSLKIFLSTTEFTCPVGETHDFAAILKSGDSSPWVDGVRLTGSSGTDALSTPTFGASALLTFGNGIFSANHPSADVHYGYILKGECTAEQIAQVARDPYGMFEMQDDYAAWRSVVAAGGALPQAVYHYNQMRAA